MIKSKIPQDQCLLFVGGHGKVNFAIKATQVLLQNPKLKGVICVGSAGSLLSDVKTFDVVIGSSSIEHDYHEKFTANAMPPEIKVDQNILSQIKGISSSDFKVHVGAIASGDEDILSKQRSLEIQKLTGALAVAWEGIGGAKACHALKKEFIEVRAITDLCETSTPKDFKNNMEKAMNHAAQVVQTILDQEP